MILESVENGPLIWPTIEENGVTRPRKYSELTHADAIQADCDVKATNINSSRPYHKRSNALVRNHKYARNIGKNSTFHARNFIDKTGKRDLHTTNIDQLHAYLGQHEFHANEVRLMHERNSDPLALSNQQPQQPEFLQLDSGLTVLVFKEGDDPIDAINHMMSFLLVVVTSRYPTTNNQLRNSSNPRQQATINDGRVTLQPVQGRQIYFATGTTRTYTPGASGSNSGKQRTVICYNCKGEGHMSKQCTKPKRKQDDSWFKDKVLLVQAQANGQILHEDACQLNGGFVANSEKMAKYLAKAKEQVALFKNFSIENIPRNLNQKADVLSKLASVAFNHLTKEILVEVLNKKSVDTEEADSKEPKLYDGNVIKNTSAIVIPDSEETLMLTEESHFEKQFVPQTKLSAEQAFWSQNSMNSSDSSPSCRPTKVEVPKELPKVSMINRSLKKLKHHLLDLTWDEIIPFVKALKDIFNTFDQYLIDELIEVQNVFHQMEQAVEQHSLESKMFEVKMNQVLNENKRLLEQVINNDIVNITVNSSVNNAYVNVHECEKCHKLETELLNKKDLPEKETYDKLSRSYTTLEKHCISLEVDTQLNHEIFQGDNSCFKSKNMNEDKAKKDIEEIETINIKLDHMVSKLCTKNEHLKQTYKQLYDSIKPTRIRSKEQCDALIHQVKQKSVEISDLKASLQEKVLVIIALKNELRKLKEKNLANNVVTKNTTTPEMLKIDVEPITLRLEVVKQGKAQNPLNNSLDSALVRNPKNKDKRVRFTEPVTSSRNTNTKTASSSNLVANKPMLSSTGITPSTSASRSQPSGNTKKDKIQQTPSSTQKNKVEAHSRIVQCSLKNKNYSVEPNRTANVQHSKLNANSKLLCVKCNGCMLSDNHDLRVLDFINNVNARAKSKSVKKSSKRKV
ncbi:integrase, catalytic region, zinc finger, CCHC-type containing protein [Tanacetum coccineum]|uniref:Integrase, catalytic region, zinc finger, CCHC-type containing protein n=1 Tax=Tanacetum coccineum TaxID=301880 RepID=A0ABQ5HCC0_9ASTR